MNEGAEKCQVDVPARPMLMTVSDTLQRRKKNLESELAEVNDAIAALAANPGVADVFDKVSRVIRR